jgi:hypothetical protein
VCVCVCVCVFILDSILSVCAVPKPRVHVLVCVRRIEERDAQNKAREEDIISKQVF